MKDWQDGLHDELAAFLKKEHSRKLILIPRNHLKTSICTVGFAVQQLLKNPNIRILITNATLRRVEEIMTQIQGYLRNSPLNALFGEFETKHTRWTIDQLTVAQRNTGAIKEPTLSIASITTNVTGGHYDLIIHDDLVERGNIATPEQIQKVKDFFTDSLNLAPNAPIVTIGTRWAVEDLYGDLLKQKDFLSFVRASYDDKGAIIFPNKVCKDRTDPDWQKKICLESQLELQGPYSFACQYMNNPVSEDTIEFKRPWIHHFDMTPELYNMFKGIEGLLSIDPAFRLKETSDSSGLVVTKTTEENTTYVLEAEAKKLNAKDLIDRIFQLVETYNVKRAILEVQAAQIVLSDLLKEEMRKRNKFFVIEEITQNSRETKAMRIRGLVPHYANGRIYHRRGLSELESELIQFPRSTHDDVLDALSQQVKFWRTPKGRVVGRSGPKQWTWEWWANHAPDVRTKTEKKFKAITRRNWV